MGATHMGAKFTTDTHLATAHVLFIDVVGYSKLLVKEQRELVQQLNQVVRNTLQFRQSEAAGKLIRLPVGDGMALVFFDTPEEPVRCATEIAKALKNHPDIHVRMGVHSGPVDQVKDVNDRWNVAGSGINTAQRVMNCGDAGHILLSKRVAEDLAQDRHWLPHLHELGDAELKHGVKLGIVNLYADEFGNAAFPTRLKAGRPTKLVPRLAKYVHSRPTVKRLLVVAVIPLIALLSLVMWKLQLKRAPDLADRTSQVPAKSIAVLPFENLTADPENAFFADGVQDEILTNLAKIADLKVISRTSVMQYRTDAKRNLREIAKALGVAHVVEGSVQRTGNRIRMRAQLIDARTDLHLWAEQYDRDLADIFAIQSEIAKTIADQLRARISAGEMAEIEKVPTTDLTAYNLYLRARLLFADTSVPLHAAVKLPQTAHLLDEALARDPRFLVGWCLLARVHCLFYWQRIDHSAARLDLANAAVQTALRLAPHAGEPHLALADYYYHGFRDYNRARSELAIARSTLPNSAEVFEYTGYIDRREGHWEEATRNLEHALVLDPRNFLTLGQLALTYHPQRRYADEMSTCDRALALVPGDPAIRMARARIPFDLRADIGPSQVMLATLISQDPSVADDVDGIDYALCERTATAAARSLKNYPRDGVMNGGVNYPHAYWEGVVARWQGDSAKAQTAFAAARSEVAKILEKQPDFPACLSLLGLIDAGLGKKEEALREGRRACELLPISADAVDGPSLAINLAQIYAWTGEKDLAIEQISAVERVPNNLSYGFLKLHPNWDSLRGDPRFEKIVASLAPKS